MTWTTGTAGAGYATGDPVTGRTVGRHTHGVVVRIHGCPRYSPLANFSNERKSLEENALRGGSPARAG